MPARVRRGAGACQAWTGRAAEPPGKACPGRSPRGARVYHVPMTPRAAPRTRLRAAVPLLLALQSLAPAALAAQTVEGTLVRYPGGEPLPGGTVTLVDSAGAPADSVRTAADGAFVLRAPRPGTWMLSFSHPGYASVPSDPLVLPTGETVEHRFAVPLVGGAALRRMSETVELEKRLQTDIVELCGERPRSWEAGILVGVVRRRPGGEPLAGAVVRVDRPASAEGDGAGDGEAPFHKATVSSANGVYVLCNVPVGTSTMRTELAGWRADEGPVEAHAGAVGWYDVYLRAR